MIRKSIANAALTLMLSAGSFAAFGQTPAPATCPNPNCPRANGAQCQQKGKCNGQGQGQRRGGCQNMGARNNANRK